MIEIIETYWNVNNNSTENFTAAQNEIIETYWNVNLICILYLFRLYREIIETYWNVNFVAKLKRPSLLRNNRNILECK